MDRPLISVIMPAFNAEAFIAEAVRSMLSQTWERWELIVIDDGSTDGTLAVLSGLQDPRITVHGQANAGVSASRNRALDLARGEYVAFLDADDVLPPRSLEARAEILLANPACSFADGVVLAMDSSTHSLRPIHEPKYQGPVFSKLMAMSPDVFCGQTWMLRRSVIGTHRFPEHMKHAEDLAFYLQLARNGLYCSTSEPVLNYRTGHRSAMSDLDGLDRGYLQLYTLATHLPPPPSPTDLDLMWKRIRRVMTRGYAKSGRPWSALRTWLRRRPTWTDR
jgi:glycosyltransferase involved in cell wall biosynthesis